MTESIRITELPQPSTDEMVTLLTSALYEAIDQLREMFPFTHGDAMSACMHVIVEAGLHGAPSPSRLREDIVKAADAVIAEKVGRTQ